MRRSLFVALLSIGIASSAGAAPMAVDGTLAFSFNYGLPSISLTGSGIGDSAGGFGSAATVPAGLFAGTTTVSVPVQPPALNLGKITIAPPFANFPGSFAPVGVMGNSLVANLFFTSGAAAGFVPLNYAGSVGTGMGNIAGLPVTFVGAAWTNLGITPGHPSIWMWGGPTGNSVFLSAFDKRTAGGQGTVQLVAPVAAKLFGGGLGVVWIVGTLTLSFVPEPGLLVLIGTGVVGLAACGRRRRTA